MVTEEAKALAVLPYHYQYRRRPLLLLEPALSLLSWMPDSLYAW
jgi:hypothetical protein